MTPEMHEITRDTSVHVEMSFNGLLSTAGNTVPTSSIMFWLNDVHCGDAVELMGKMPADSVGCIVTSPPYNLRNSTGNGMKDGRGGKWKNAELIKGYSTRMVRNDSQ